MNKEKNAETSNPEAPIVFRVAQLPASGGSTMDRRTFVKGTMAAVGAGALMTVLNGCESGGGGDDDPCVCNTVCPCEQVGACQCDVVACQCQFGCQCHSVCPCETVGSCTCNVVQTTCVETPGQAGTVKPGQTGINFVGPAGETRTMPCGTPIPAGWTCTCNCVSVPAACTCNGHCACNGQGHYWHPC